MGTTGNDDRNDDRHRAIVEAATSLFGRYGYRRTSMDLIAAEAGLAKGTLYAYFSGKEALFRGVCEHVAATFMDAAERAYACDDAVEEQLLGMLQAKFTYLYELVHSSPHAAEIVASQNRVGGGVIAAADQRYLGLLTEVIATAAERGQIDLQRIAQKPADAARLLYRCAHGATHGASDSADHRRHLAELVRLFMAGLEPVASV